MDRRVAAIKLEQFRQAKRIHGGLMKLAIAILGIRLSRMPIPSKRLRAGLYRRIFTKKYPPGLDENEADKPLWAYPSLNALFTRGIKPEFRPIPAGTPQFLCPCDGVVQDVGRIERAKLVTVKKIEYTLDSLLPLTEVGPFEGGHFAVIFLSPLDCHRVFSPHETRLDEVVHVPGHRLLVHPPYQRAEYPVYTLNERVIFRLSTALGPCLVVMVAGWGVGNITLPFDPSFRPKASNTARRSWSTPINFARGECLATFQLGSTVVLIAPPATNVTPLISNNERVKYGQPAFTYAR